MMENICICCILFLTVQNLVSSQAPDGSSPLTPRVPPFSTFLSEFGNFIQDVDDTVYRLTAPKEERENLKRQTDGGKRVNYFDRVRENYEDLQRQIRQTLEPSSGLIKTPELVNINFQNKGQKAFLDVSLPFLPMNVNVKAKNSAPKSGTGETVKFKTGDVTHEFPKLELPYSDVVGSINIGGQKANSMNFQKDSVESITDAQFDTNPDNFQKRSNRNYRQGYEESVPKYNMQNSHASLSSGKETGKDSNKFASEHSSVEEPTMGDSEVEQSESKNQERILGDLLFSESTFDEHFKRALKGGKWLVDPGTFLPKGIVENVRGITKNPLTNNASPSGKRRGILPEVPQEQTQDTKSRDKHHVSSEEPMHQRYPTAVSDSKHEQSSKLILAFTPEGVPLKLKIDPRVGNPLKFLHRTLTASGVSLNIPIESHRSLQPAGSDVLQLGSGRGGVETQALYLDLTDENQLNAFLETLKKFRNEDI